MNEVLGILAGTPTITLVIGCVLVLLAGFFAVYFLARALVLIVRLSGIAASLKGLKNPQPQALKQAFSKDVMLSHLLREYLRTLHKVEDVGGGKPLQEGLRSTAPASSIFTTEAIVDARLLTEFFKHLPGIFTGIGIIGTFSGLIRGLQAFQASADAAVVRGGLEVLMHRVSDAFYVSAAAIFLAMLTTLIERICVTIVYKKIEDITSRIDGFFVSGAGEEYLARMTRASEESAAQSKILKDALVGDLERILTTLAERQIEAHGAGVQRLGRDISREITDTLSGPLDALAATARRNSEGNSEAVTQLLTDVLAGFSQRMEDLFGGQVAGINKLQQQTIDSLGAAVGKLNQMVSAVEDAGTKSADALNQRLLSALKDMEAHEKAANERMATFIDQMRGSMDQTQTETYRKLQETLAQLGAAVEAQLAALRQQGERTAAAQIERDGVASARTDELLRNLGNRVDEVLGAMKAQADRSGAAQVDRDRRSAEATNDNIAKLAAAVQAQMANLNEQAERSASAQGAREIAAAAKTDETLRLLGARVDEVMGGLREHLDIATEAQGRREQQLSEAMAAAVSNLTGVAQTMVSEARAVALGVSAAVDAMRGATTTAIDRMNNGSETLYLAASEFTNAGQSISNVFQQAEGLSQGLRQSAGSIAEASSALQGVVADHAKVREALTEMIGQMRVIIENARREASVATDVIARIEAASQGLAQAQKQAEGYLDEVTKILAATHEKYATSLSNALQD
jgi:hypothetical protein